MAIENYRKETKRYFIGRINVNGQEEFLRLEGYNALPTAIRDQYQSGQGFTNAQTAMQGVTFFNAVEAEKGEAREYWYFRNDVVNVAQVILNDSIDPVIVQHFQDKQERENNIPTG